jgi:hypothetical protein
MFCYVFMYVGCTNPFAIILLHYFNNLKWVKIIFVRFFRRVFYFGKIATGTYDLFEMLGYARNVNFNH